MVYLFVESASGVQYYLREDIISYYYYYLLLCVPISFMKIIFSS